MGSKTESALVDRAEEILEDGTSNLIFTEALIKSQMQDGLSEISQFVPNEVKHILNTFNNSKELDLSTITGINDIRKIEFPVGKDPRVFRNFNYWGDVVELDIQNSARPAASVLGDLTGTVTFSDGSTAISGSGTAFTTELEEGWYIKKSTSSTWHRIATITDDTNLVLETQVATADDGADTVGATDYWFQYAFLYCSKVHYLSQLTDLLGAIDLTAGYEAGAMLIHIDSLQASGTITKNTVLTIAGVSDSYRVTADATIASNECDVKISPSLAGDVGNDAVVTIRSSSLTSELERILPELTAGRVAKNWIGDLRTQIDGAIVAIDLANTQVDLIAARNTQMVTDVASIRSAVNASLAVAKTAITLANTEVDLIGAEITQIGTDVDSIRSAANAKLTEAQAAIALANTQADSAVTQAAAIVTAIGDHTGSAQEVQTAIELANTQLDLAIADLVLMQTDITDNDAAFDAALVATNTALDKAVADIASGDALLNIIPIGGSDTPTKYQQAAMAQVSTARGFAQEAMALATEKNDYNQLAIAELQSARVSFTEAQMYLSLEGAITRENALAVSAYMQAGQGFIREAQAYTQSDAQQVANYARVVGGDVSTINSLLNKANGYFREADTYVRADASTTAGFLRTVQGETATVRGLLSNAGGYFSEARTRFNVAPAINSQLRWANEKINQAQSDLRRLSKPRQKNYNYSRS